MAALAKRRLFLATLRLRLRGAFGTALLLIGITALGGALRFAALDRPTIWGDEAATWYRVVGSYRQLLGELQNTSFAPLHYQLYWWIGQGLPVWGEIVPAGTTPERQVRDFVPARPLLPGLRLTPHAMRAVPAIGGTLMIPAMYFLARQMFGRRVALLAAVLTCFNAYLLAYARDAKMYSHFWLMCTLHVGCLLWWLRTRTLTAWLCWVACGVAMVGLHKLGDFLLAVDVLVFVVAPRQNWSSIVRLVGLIGWAIALPVVAAVELIRRKRALRSPLPRTLGGGLGRGPFQDSMILEVKAPTPALAREYAGEGAEGRSRFARFLAWPLGVGRKFALPPVLLFVPGLLLIASATSVYYDQFIQRTDRVVRADGSINMTANGTGWVSAYNDGRGLGDYLLYTASAYLTGWEWPGERANHFMDASQIDPRTLKLHKAGTVLILSGLAAGLVPWRKIFATRRGWRRLRRDDRPLAPAFASRRLWWLAAWAIVPAYVLYGQSLTHLATPADGPARLLLKAPPAVQWPRLPTLPKARPGDAAWPSYLSGDVWRTFGEAQRTAWQKFAAAFTPANFDVATCVVIAAIAVLAIVAVAWRRRLLARPALSAALVVVALFVVVTVLGWVPRRVNGSAWMPRYAAVVLPAVIVGAASLISRLPGWPTRAAFVALFAVINYWQFSSRVFSDSEIPIDRIARDVIDAQPRDVIPGAPATPTRRTYVLMPANSGGGSPGRGTLDGVRGAYYLWLYSKLPAVPREVRRGYSRQFRVWPATTPDAIDRDLTRSRQIDRFVVWTGLAPGKVDHTDPIAAQLAGRFRRTGDETIPVYDHWTWTHLYTLRRREYVKLPGADAPPATQSTQAATRPATSPSAK